MAIKFLDKYKTGFLEIDDQHKELFKRIELLYQACANSQGKQKIKEIMDYLEEYVTKHFSIEEKYMEKFIYSGAFMHKASHNQFKQIYAELKDDFEKGGSTTSFVIRINRTLINWLISHMGNEDKKLADFLKLKLK